MTWRQYYRSEYFGHFVFVIFVDILNLSYYVINLDIVSLFTNSSFYSFNDIEFVLL